MTAGPAGPREQATATRTPHVLTTSRERNKAKPRRGVGAGARQQLSTGDKAQLQARVPCTPHQSTPALRGARAQGPRTVQYEGYLLAL